MITTPKIPAGEARLTPVPGGLMVRARSVEEREWYPEIGDVVWDCFYAGRRREDTRTPLKVISTPALVRWGHSATGPEFGWVVVVERPKPQGWYEMDEDDEAWEPEEAFQEIRAIKFLEPMSLKDQMALERSAPDGRVW